MKIISLFMFLRCFPVVLIALFILAIVIVLLVLYLLGEGSVDEVMRDITDIYRFNKIYSKLDNIDRNLDDFSKTVAKRKSTGRKITRTVAHKDKGIIAQEIIEE